MSCRRSSRFWGLGCPKIFHEIEDSLVGVDETAFRKRHDYVSIVSDQDNGTVLYVGKDRKKADLTRIAHRFSDFGVFRRRDLSEAT